MSIAEIPVAILQGIFFHKDRPRYMNYAAIGCVIGHEISHAFDHEGSQFDKEGNFAPWWTKKTEEQYSEEIKCLVDQYNNFIVKEVNMHVRIALFTYC